MSKASDSQRTDAAAGPILNGTVQRYFEDIRMGTIKADSGELYTFQSTGWTAESEPAASQKVIFQIEGARAVNIRPAK